jgi:hypothetical protein
MKYKIYVQYNFSELYEVNSPNKSGKPKKIQFFIDTYTKNGIDSGFYISKN